MIEVLEELDRARRSARRIHQRVVPTLMVATVSSVETVSIVEAWVALAELALCLSVDEDPPQRRLADLLALLRHWADANGVDFEAALNKAEWEYQIERIDPHYSIEAPASPMKWRLEAVRRPT